MLVPIMLLGFLLRLIGADQSFWLDEGASIEIAKTPLVHFWAKMATDFHPPLFYLLLKSWLPFAGDHEWLIRLPFILIATLSIPALYFLLKELLGSKGRNSTYLIAGFLLAISPFHVYYSQELRMYSLNTLLTILSWLCLLRLARRDTGRNWFFYIATTVLNIYTFYGAFFNLAAQVVYLFLKKKFTLRIVSAVTVSLLLFLPWLPVLSHQLAVGGYLKNSLPGWQFLSGTLTLKSLALIPLKLIAGRITFSPKVLYYLLAGALCFLYLLLAFLGSLNKRSKLLLAWIGMPLFIATLLSLKTPVLGYWRYLFILPPTLSLTAIGLGRLRRSRIPVLVIIGLLTFIPLLIYYLNPNTQREDWRSLSHYIDKPDSVTVIEFPDAFAPLKFYLPGGSYMAAEDTLGHVRSDLTTSIASSGAKTVFLLDYLANITDPQRQVSTDIKNAGYRSISQKSFINLGTVTEYRPSR